MSRPLILAHRGDWSQAGENSLEAFRAAFRRPGVDGVEFDVRAARDGTPVVIHDATLRRLRGVRRRVRDLPTSALRDFGVLSLDEVLDSLPPPFFLDIELKEDVGLRASQVIIGHRGDPPREVAVSSFQPAIIRSVSVAHADWRCWLITRRLNATVVAEALDSGCVGLAVRWPALGPNGRRLVDSAGLELATWTVEDPAVMARVIGLGLLLVAVCVDPLALPVPRGAARGGA